MRPTYYAHGFGVLYFAVVIFILWWICPFYSRVFRWHDKSHHYSEAILKDVGNIGHDQTTTNNKTRTWFNIRVIYCVHSTRRVILLLFVLFILLLKCSMLLNMMIYTVVYSSPVSKLNISLLIVFKHNRSYRYRGYSLLNVLYCVVSYCLAL